MINGFSDPSITSSVYYIFFPRCCSVIWNHNTDSTLACWHSDQQVTHTQIVIYEWISVPYANDPYHYLFSGWTYSETIGENLNLIKPTSKGNITIYGEINRCFSGGLDPTHFLFIICVVRCMLQLLFVAPNWLKLNQPLYCINFLQVFHTVSILISQSCRNLCRLRCFCTILLASFNI